MHTRGFNRRFQKRAFEAAEAYDLALEGEEEDAEDNEEEDDDDDDDDDDWEENCEDAEEEEADADDDADEEELASSRLLRSSLLSAESSASDDGGGDRPSELVLRFLPLLSEALRGKLRPGGQGETAPEGGAEGKEAFA